MIVELTTLIMFILASFALILTPGPIVSLLLSETLTYGARQGLAVLLGAFVTGSLFLAVYVFGLAPLMMKLPHWAFDLVRYIGAVFLLFLSASMIRTSFKYGSSASEEELTAVPSFKAAFIKAFIAVLANPKAVVFFAAFFSQFIDATRPVQPQLITLSTVFICVGLIGDSCWIFFAHKARPWLYKKGGTRLINRISGTALGLGAILLLFLNP
ncbi:transporter [Kordiimonas sediminis]|uniref:Transporter n=1 Tax=Kordiimonas sediminis TaxID=1735581 RepID=A0A919AWE0_9PROT|nr:LysE family translocator [Kordiimonas sediminis]GHF28018.1 transporter [Kordiimonas sediminis]